MINTVNDFWCMIWENNVSVIVMLTNLEERGRVSFIKYKLNVYNMSLLYKVKCHQYWPVEGENIIEYGPLQVKFVEESSKDHQVIRTFILSEGGKEKALIQYHFTSWPDYGVPSSAGKLLEFMDEVKKGYDPFEGPMVVHCRLVRYQLKYEE